MAMQKLVAGLLAPFDVISPHGHAHSREIDKILNALKKKQDQLEQRLAHETRSASQRRLKIDLEVTRLQYKKAMAMRSDLQHH